MINLKRIFCSLIQKYLKNDSWLYEQKFNKYSQIIIRTNEYKK